MAGLSDRLLRTVDHPEYLEEIAALLTEGFMDNPVYTSLAVDEDFRRKVLMYINKARLSLLGSRSEFWLDETGTRVQGHVVVSHESGMSPSLLTLIKAGLLSVPFRFGIGVFLCFNSIMDQFKANQARVLGAPDYFTLEAFVIEAQSRGKGLGSQMLTELLAKRLQKGQRIVLMTQEDRNVKLYEKHGFVVLDSTPLQVKAPTSSGNIVAIPNWIMQKEF